MKIPHVFGGPGSGRHPEGGSSQKSASDIRNSVQKSLGSKVADPARATGAKTYVSSSSSPNLVGGDRHFIDISHNDPKIESEHSSQAQQHLNQVSSDIRQNNPGAMTYVSSMKSPNMGTRTYMDVKLTKQK